MAQSWFRRLKAKCFMWPLTDTPTNADLITPSVRVRQRLSAFVSVPLSRTIYNPALPFYQPQEQIKRAPILVGALLFAVGFIGGNDLTGMRSSIVNGFCCSRLF